MLEYHLIFNIVKQIILLFNVFFSISKTPKSAIDIDINSFIYNIICVKQNLSSYGRKTKFICIVPFQEQLNICFNEKQTK